MKSSLLRPCLVFGLILGLCFPSDLPAQASGTTQELLARVPRDFGLVLTVQDLRGNWERLQKAPWMEGLKKSALGQAVLQAPEMQKLIAFEEELKKHLTLSYPDLRDDILGDAVVLAFRPAPPLQPDGEAGLIFLKARNADLLNRVIARLNFLQRLGGEIQGVEEVKHAGTVYFRRLAKHNPSYYALEGPTLLLATREETLKSILESKPESAGLIFQHLQKAEADRALLSLWFNPRAIDAELEQQARKEMGPNAALLEAFIKSWKGLEAAVVSFNLGDVPELRVSLQGRPSEMPAPTRRWFTQGVVKSELWNQFPAPAILGVALHTNFSLLFETVTDFAPPEAGKALHQGLQKSVGAVLGVDVARELLPNIGPDFGVSVFRLETSPWPQTIAALAVKPLPADAPTDQNLFKTVQFFANMAIFNYNRSTNNPIRVKTIRQDQVEVKYLSHDQLFPPGIQPAAALKNGYLVLATSPEAIARFGTSQKTSSETQAVPLAVFSAGELSQALKQHQELIISGIAKKNDIPRPSASQAFQAFLSVLDLIDSVELATKTTGDQVTWILSVRPRK